MSDLKQRLFDACVGNPVAEIPWPHRLLHDAAERIAALEAENAKLRAVVMAAKRVDESGFGGGALREALRAAGIGETGK